MILFFIVGFISTLVFDQYYYIKELERHLEERDSLIEVLIDTKSNYNDTKYPIYFPKP